MTFDQVKKLGYRDIIHHNTHKNSDGTCQRWRVNGQLKLWKTRPGEFKLPIKYGMRTCDYLTHNELNLVHLESECTNPKQ